MMLETESIHCMRTRERGRGYLGEEDRKEVRITVRNVMQYASVKTNVRSERDIMVSK